VIILFFECRRRVYAGVCDVLRIQPACVSLILLQVLRLVVTCVAMGIAGGAAISRLLEVVLVDLSPLDRIAFGGVTLKWRVAR